MTFATDELVSSTNFVRNFSSIMDKLNSSSIQKVGILKNNSVKAVLLSENMYEKILEYIEDLEDAALVEKRMKNDDWTRYTMEEIAKECDIDLTSL